MRDIKFRALKVAYVDKGSFGTRYEVYSDGRVVGTATGKRVDLKQWKDRDGYPHVTLVKEGKHYPRAVHKLVANAFLLKPSPKHQVNHKNGVRDDNRLENLNWLTHQENVLHGWRENGRVVTEHQREVRSRMSKGANNPRAKLVLDDVMWIREFRSRGKSLKEIALYFDISVSQVSAICTGRSWS